MVKHSTCTRIKNNVRTRYRRCKACNHPFKTEQQVTPEIIVPSLPSYPRFTKLTPNDVREIRSLLKKGLFNSRDLALQYEVTPSVIHSIKRRDTWKNLPDNPPNA